MIYCDFLLIISVVKMKIKALAPCQVEKIKKKNPFPRYDQVQNGILHVMVAALFEVQNYFHLVKFLCFLLISEMFNEPYLLQFPGDLSLIL